MNTIRCDGCDQELSPRDICLAGKRVDGFSGAGLPDARSPEFHFCRDCSVVAMWAAVTRPESIDYTEYSGQIIEVRRLRKVVTVNG